MTPTITTVIPTYRRPGLLRRAILSVLAQTWPDFEVHVFDDASEDDTKDLVAQFIERDSRVRYFCNARNLGMMPNAAQALASVRSPFFTILNDDDFLAPDFFQTAMESFERWPAAAVFVGRLIYWDVEIPERTRSYYSWTKEEFIQPPNVAVDVMSTDQNHTWTSMMFRREVYAGVGGHDPEYPYLDDLDFLLRVLAHYPSILSPRPCAVYYLSPYSSSHRDYLTRYLLGAQRMLTKFRANTTLAPQSRRRLVDALEDHFRRAVVVGAARSLTLEDLEPARHAADFLEQQFRARLAAFAIRFAAKPTAAGAASRAALRRVKLARRRLRRDPGLADNLAYIDQLLSRFEHHPDGERVPACATGGMRR